MLAMSTFLDPRFKKPGFASANKYTECRDKIQAAASNVVLESDPGPVSTTSSSSTSSALNSTSSLWTAFDKDVAEAVAKRTTCSGILEVRQFIAEAPIQRSADPMKYWQRREAAYPRLSILARKYLSLVATSVPSERVFSTAGQVISERRSRLTTEHVEQILFMHENIKYFTV